MTQTINLANIRIGMDIDKLKEGGIKARQELSALTRMLKAGEEPWQKFAAAKEKADRALATGGVNQDAYDQLIRGAMKSSGLQAGVDSTLAEVRRQEEARLARVKQLTEQVATAQEKHNARMREYKALSSQLSGETMKRLQEASLLKMQAEQSGGDTSIIGSLTGLFSPKVMAIGAAIGGIASAKQFAQESAKAFSDLESSMVQLTVLTGSNSVAKKLYEDFRRLDRESPLSAQAFQKAAVTLIGYGTSVKSVVPALESMSQIAMGNEEKFQSLTLAFGQVQAAGRLMGQEVLQMVNAGFNPLQQISKDTGKSMSQLKAEMEAGSISAEMVAKAFQSATAAGGKFAGMNESLAKTQAGQYAKLQSEYQALQQQVGRVFQPATDAGMRAAAGVLGAYSSALQFATSRAVQLESAISKASEAPPLKALIEAARSQFGILGTLSKFFALPRNDVAAGIPDTAKLEKERSAVAERFLAKQTEIRKELEKQRIELREQITLKEKGARAAAYEKALRDGLHLYELMQNDALKNRLTYLERIDAYERKRLEIKGKQSLLDSLDRQKMLNEGFTPEQAKSEIGRNRKLRMEEEARAAKEAAAQVRRELEAEAEAVKKSLLTPAMALQEQIKRLRELFNDGFLSGEQLAKASERAALNMKQSLIPSGVAPSIKANTAEAYRFVQQQNEQRRIAAEAKKLAEKSNRHLEAIENAVKDVVVLRKKR